MRIPVISPVISMVVAMLTIAGSAVAAADELPPAYVPQEQVSGVIRIWGHGSYDPKVDFIEALVRNWEAGFHRF